MQARTKDQQDFIKLLSEGLPALEAVRQAEKNKSDFSDTLDQIHCITSLIHIFNNPEYDNKFFDECCAIYRNQGMSYEEKAKKIRTKVIFSDYKEDDELRNPKRYNIHQRNPYYNDEQMREVERQLGIKSDNRSAPQSAMSDQTDVRVKKPMHSTSAPAAMARPQQPPAVTKKSSLNNLSVFSHPPTSPAAKTAKKTLKCDVVMMQTAPTKETLASLPIQSKRAYVRCGNDLYYVNKIKNRCTKLNVDAATVAKFDENAKPSAQAKLLTMQQLDAIRGVIGKKGHAAIVKSPQTRMSPGRK